MLHSESKKYFHIPFLVLQLVTNRGLMSVHGRTNQCLEGLQKGSNIPNLVLPGTDRSLFVTSRSTKKVLGSTFSLQSVATERVLMHSHCHKYKP